MNRLDSWDRQQEVYIRDRERRYDVMLAFLAELAPPEPLVLDLAAGPGSTAVRVLDRLPGARCLAVDVDPVLQRLGRDAYGDAGGRLTWIRADLRDPSWPSALGVGRVDAVVSTTALHWLRPEELAPLYRTLRELLAESGGPFLNGDHLPFPRETPRIRAAAERVDQRRQDAAVAAGADDWAAWWEALRADPDLAAEHAERDALWAGSRRDFTSASLAFHQAALDTAGFTESAIVWQDLDERVLLALP
ncbi:class I SAM-dependent methyltransferase [Jiangella muralis]|uniref:class I SAM-dependent methyltransferase n=1 Tax=Jiangella muralis TaxID=702383 RepID=UPI00069FAB1B|nr:class I SAM-dependent methyltransferase [Jiangella muralis]